MSIYIGNDLEDRLEALEAKNTILKGNSGFSTSWAQMKEH